ncbi:MAG: electron transfer flavoprotein subunit beta/FixA family protein, partial [candidate division WOR-3 bacterium]
STETKIRINTKTGFVDTSEVEWVINPYDEYAIETALRLREQIKAGSVTAVSLGPERTKTALRTALAMGVDDAVHVWDEAFGGIDSLSTGRVLATALKRLSFDVVFCGKQAIDDDFAAVPPAIAHFLGIPHVSVVPEVALNQGEAAELTAHREVEGATEVVRVKTPCLITIQKGKYEPRYPTLKLMMAAKKKEIPRLGAAELGIDPATLTRRIVYLGDRLPPGRKPGQVLTGEPAELARELVHRLREEARVI